MPVALTEVYLPLKTPDGTTLAQIRVAAHQGNSKVPAILMLDAAEAKQWHEQPIQLLEGLSYDYEIQIPFSGARLREGVIHRSSLSSAEVERGRLEPGPYTGILVLILEDRFGQRLAAGAVEVRSVKLNYRVHYRQMLDDIADRTLDLLVDLKAPSSTWLRPIQLTTHMSLVQRFFLIKHLITGFEIEEAIGRIIRNPHEATRREYVDQPIGKGVRGNGDLGRQLATRQPRLVIPPSHCLSSRCRTIPRLVSATAFRPTQDTPENRFIKFVLKSFDDFVAKFERDLKQANSLVYRHIIAECADIRGVLSTFRAHLLFRDIGEVVQSLPLASPVLQRRAGYREIFRAWILFSLAAELNWDGADDVFLAGKRDVASLYEYWVFFQLFDLVKSKFSLPVNWGDNLLTWGPSGLTFHLKSGSHVALLGKWEHATINLNFRFSYNRTFSRVSTPSGDTERSYPNGGSWTRSMRPDYTISFWPARLTEDAAELSDNIVHLHFDAKYRVESLTELFGENVEEGLESESELTGFKSARRSDLLKMHAYRDAIRRSASAFVLYPGSDNQRWRAYTEILPGLGALALVPGDDAGKRVLESFLDEAASLVATRFCQQES